MAESVDALVSNTSGATRAGSTPALGTEILSTSIVEGIFYFYISNLGYKLATFNNKAHTYLNMYGLFLQLKHSLSGYIKSKVRKSFLNSNIKLRGKGGGGIRHTSTL